MKKLFFVLLCLVSLGLLFNCVGAPKGRLAVKSCIECHEKEYKQFVAAKNVHTPVKEKQCEACHRPHGLIGGVYLKQGFPELCFSCHEETKKTKGKNAHPPFEKGDCIKCHNPHSSSHAALLEEGKRNTCLTCHESEKFRQEFIHLPGTARPVTSRT
jgi:predicted CXXCH cytochrome family protein